MTTWIIENTDASLWQELKKEDLDQEDKLTDEQWLKFCENYKDSFAESSSEIGHNQFNQFCKDMEIEN